MNAVQGSLFSSSATRGAARRNGPATSRDAARSMDGHVLRDQQAHVLAHLLDVCRFAEDATAWELWRSDPDGPKENVVSKRLGELRDAGMVRLTQHTRAGSSHRHQQVWAPTEKAREWQHQRWEAS